MALKGLSRMFHSNGAVHSGSTLSTPPSDRTARSFRRRLLVGVSAAARPVPGAVRAACRAAWYRHDPVQGCRTSCKTRAAAAGRRPTDRGGLREALRIAQMRKRASTRTEGVARRGPVQSSSAYRSMILPLPLSLLLSGRGTAGGGLDRFGLRLRLIVDGGLRSELFEPFRLRHRRLGVRIERRLPDHRLDLLPVDDQAVQLGDPGDRGGRWTEVVVRHGLVVDSTYILVTLATLMRAARAFSA